MHCVLRAAAGAMEIHCCLFRFSFVVSVGKCVCCCMEHRRTRAAIQKIYFAIVSAALRRRSVFLAFVCHVPWVHGNNVEFMTLNVIYAWEWFLSACLPLPLAAHLSCAPWCMHNNKYINVHTVSLSTSSPRYFNISINSHSTTERRRAEQSPE